MKTKPGARQLEMAALIATATPEADRGDEVSAFVGWQPPDWVDNGQSVAGEAVREGEGFLDGAQLSVGCRRRSHRFDRGVLLLATHGRALPGPRAMRKIAALVPSSLMRTI
jgi:hypothetical protein